MSFETLGLSPQLLSAVSQQGYTTPTPVQKQAIPAIIHGRDIIASAQTGTGKTAGFTLPLLQRLSDKPIEKKHVRALIITPTRELAAQVHDSVTTYARNLPIKASAVFGGVNIRPQILRLKRKDEIVIATPGRLLDLVNQRALDLSKVEILVLDEADRMLDMGFIDDIKRILKLLPEDRQNLLFSATYSKEINTLATKLLNNPEKIQIARENVTAAGVTHLVHPVDKSCKRQVLSFLIGSQNWKQVLVFVRTKHGADRLSRQLEADGLKSTSLHGDKTQSARTRALKDFKEGKARILVATDIAARGLDIDSLPYVVNFNLPQHAEDYVHRIGRTGRASKKGLALSLVSADEAKLLHAIEKLLNQTLPREELEGYEPEHQVPERSKSNPRANAGARHKRNPRSFKGKSKGSGKPSGRFKRKAGRNS